MKGKAIIAGLFVFVVCLGSVYLARMRGAHTRNVTHKDFGLVSPNHSVEFTDTVVNTGDKPLILDGFDKACGLRAFADDDGVVPPGGSTRVTLIARSNTVSGPGGVSFELGIQGNGKRRTKDYVLSWIVGPHPSLSAAQLWFSRDNDSARRIYLVNAAGDSKVESTTAPDTYSLSVKATEITVRPIGAFDRLKTGRLDVVIRGGGETTSLAVPILKVGSGRLSLYPNFLYLSAGGPAVRAEILDTLGQRWTVVSPPKRLSASIWEGSVWVRGGSSRSDFSATIRLKDSMGRMLELPVYVGANE